MEQSTLAARTKRTTGEILVLVWFALLFFMSILAAAVTLSTSQLQSRLQSLSSADTSFSVWQIERIRKQWDAQLAAFERQSDIVEFSRARWASLRDDLELAEAKSEVLIDIYGQGRDAIAAKLKLYEPLLIPDDFANLQGQQLRAKIEDVIERLRGKLREETQNTVNRLYETYLDALKAMETGLSTYKAAALAAQRAQESLKIEEANTAEAERKLDQIIDPEGKMSKGDEARIYDLISEFGFIERFAMGTLYKFAILPSDFLIIVLVVAMGVLGSTMQLTYDHYRANGIGRTSLFFLRPMLGAITALVVFILLKAGVLVVTDSAKLGEVAPLNPFFVAFVGIASGLLSENALEMVRNVGQTWLRHSGTPSTPRWAVGLKAQLSPDKSIADLAARAGVDEAEVGRWVDEEVAVSPEMQRLVAAWLGMDVRTLFTDIPPRQPA